MVLGGGGSPTPKAEIIVQLGFVAAVLAWTWWAGRSASVPRPLLLFGAALVALPLIQLVPLPPVIWQALPGREFQLANLALVGAEDSWRPLSISPSLTLAGLLALIPAVGTMWAVSTLDHRDRRFLLLTIGLIALTGAGLGALQLAGGPEAFRLYEKQPPRLAHRLPRKSQCGGRRPADRVARHCRLVRGRSEARAGPVPPSPSELLASPRMAQLLEHFADKYGVVIVDSPPVLGLADAPMLSAIADGTVFVIEADRGRSGALKAALRRLRAMEPNILGAVLAKFDPSRADNRYSAYYGYDYYAYAEDGGRKDA